MPCCPSKKKHNNIILEVTKKDSRELKHKQVFYLTQDMGDDRPRYFVGQHPTFDDVFIYVVSHSGMLNTLANQTVFVDAPWSLRDAQVGDVLIDKDCDEHVVVFSDDEYVVTTYVLDDERCSIVAHKGANSLELTLASQASPKDLRT